MTDLEIIKQLMNGNHLNDLELLRAVKLIHGLSIAIKTRCEKC